MHTKFFWFGLIAACLTLPISVLVHAAEFHGLGHLPGGESHNSSSSGISADGDVAVGPVVVGRAKHGVFFWTKETGMVGLGFVTAEGLGSGVNGISADGTTVVGNRTSSMGTKAYRWSLDNGGVQDLGGSRRSSIPLAANRDGSIVVGQSDNRAFIWTEGAGRSYLPPVPWMGEMQRLSARDISSDGTVVAGNSKVGFLGWGDEGFLWSADNGYIHILPENDIVTTEVRAVSDDGTTVVGGVDYIVDGHVPGGAMWWRRDVGVVDVGGLSGHKAAGSFFYDISGNGLVAVGQEAQVDGVHPVNFVPIVWDEFHGVRNIEELLKEESGLAVAMEGWKLQRAFAVSHDGLTIVGGGVNPQGNNEAWRVVLDERPALDLAPGDANLDGKVDFADFLRLAANFESGAFWYQGDFDGNHQVELEDFVILAEAFGGTTVVSIPEPDCVPSVPTCFAFFVVLQRCKRRRIL